MFDNIDESLDGHIDGIIRVEDFKKMLKDYPLWGEAVPHDLEDHIMRTIDMNSDGVINFEGFLELVRARAWASDKGSAGPFRNCSNRLLIS